MCLFNNVKFGNIRLSTASWLAWAAIEILQVNTSQVWRFSQHFCLQIPSALNVQIELWSEGLKLLGQHWYPQAHWHHPAGPAPLLGAPTWDDCDLPALEEEPPHPLLAARTQPQPAAAQPGKSEPAQVELDHFPIYAVCLQHLRSGRKLTQPPYLPQRSVTALSAVGTASLILHPWSPSGQAPGLNPQQSTTKMTNSRKGWVQESF